LEITAAFAVFFFKKKPEKSGFVEKVQQFSFCTIVSVKGGGPALVLQHFVALC
jgi:hypothetical protein